MKTLDLQTRNTVLTRMAQLIREETTAILDANQQDMEAYTGQDLAMGDRLLVTPEKIEGMVAALEQLAAQKDPLDVERFAFTHENGLQISNRTAPFGTILIIYESRPDVTIEAAGIAFKSGNKILLKGGKESLRSNMALATLWHRALDEAGCDREWISYLNYNRKETQAFLENPTERLDLIVPRGGERLIQFVKEHAQCPVIVSGRGNNFLYVAPSAQVAMAQKIILNAKTAKISACNALDKVLVDAHLPDLKSFIHNLIGQLEAEGVTVLVDQGMGLLTDRDPIKDGKLWETEFLDYKILIGLVENMETAVDKTNTHSGGHSASIITEDEKEANVFMAAVDSAAVYHNASTRFTDGGQFGLAGELAISTDKLHQRGPIGLQHLVSNKWYVKGQGQIR